MWPQITWACGSRRRAGEIPASLFQAANPIYILLLGLVFTAAWGWLGARGLEPGTPLKFALGLLQLGLGFAVFWLGAHWPTPRHGRHGLAAAGIPAAHHRRTVPVARGAGHGHPALPRPPGEHRDGRLVSGHRGLAFLAAIIAQFTRVGQAGAEAKWIPPPQETLGMYANVYGLIAVAATASAVICLALVPLLTGWMHEDATA